MGRILWVTLFIIFIRRSVHADGNESDENRPYKFAFNIEGYQHRAEEKDVDGIIMGEFGFVTGDGIYHVTVYATDKDGDFKIVSMKSYYVGLPGEPTTSKPVPTERNQILAHLDGLKGCSGCVIPSKTTPSSKSFSPGYNQLNTNSGNDFNTGPQVSKAQVDKIGNVENKASFEGKVQHGKPAAGVPAKASVKPTTLNTEKHQHSPSPQNQPGNESPEGQLLGYSGSPSSPKTPETPSKSFNGLPPGMTMEDLQALLYKFNYTLRFHGHHESGYRSGDKEGGYFFNGRDGLGRDVKYIANEFGFQPNISLIQLGLNSPDTPKEESEKELNELKGNEFKWFYQR